MALADPQSVTLAAAVSLPRIETDLKSATYTSADGTVSLHVSHTQKGGRIRTLVRVQRKEVSTNVLTDIKSEIGAVVNFSIDRPAVGFTEAKLIELINSVGTWLSASTNANAKKILGQES